jgi:acyl carrier protein
MTKEEAREQIREWIVARSGKVRPEEIRGDTPVLEQRIISSLEVVELVVFLESLRGGPIDYDRLNGKSLRSIDAMWEAFLSEGAT